MTASSSGSGIPSVKPPRTPGVGKLEPSSTNWLGESMTASTPKSPVAPKSVSPVGPVKNVSAKMRKPGMRKRGMIK